MTEHLLDDGRPSYTIKAFRLCKRAISDYNAMPIPKDENVTGEDALKLAAEDAYATLYYWPQNKWPRPKPGSAPKRVAIVGKGPSHHGAPWGQKGWELWGLNECTPWPGYAPIEAHTRWFQLHPPRYLKKHHPDGILDLKQHWTKDRGIPCYMDRHYVRYPNSTRYPKQEVEALTPHGRYHTISFDWMVALAILEGFEEIALHACNLYTGPVMNGESLSGRASVEYWSGVAEGRGARVTTHGNTDLFRTVHMARRVSDLQYGWDREPGHDLGDGWRDMR